MSLTNPNTPVSQQDLQDFYHKILPYMGGSADAGFTPVGSVIAIMGLTAPANYLACDGTVYNISDYPELATYFYQQFGSKNKFGGNGTTTFAVPDLRGEFLRGTGTNSHTNQGSGANVGNHQDATEIPNIGVNTTSQKALFTLSDTGSILATKADSAIVEATTTGLQTVKNSMSTTWEGAEGISRYTSRPTNTSILWCIATKNIYLNPANDYSTEEKIVGTWIDGKPLYQKTIVNTMPSELYDGKYSKSYPIGASVEFGFIAQASFIVGTGVQQLFTINDALSTAKLGKIGVSTNQDAVVPNCVYVRMNNADWINLPCYLTVNYTKTTD